MLRNKIKIFVLAGAAIFIGLTSGNNSSADDLARGLLLYQSNCVQCHGEKGDGDGPESVNLETKPWDFNSSRMAALTDSQLDKAVVEGFPTVPSHSWGNRMSKDDIAAVLGYIKTFHK